MVTSAEHHRISGRCLITGASGALGPAVVAVLQRRFSAVRVMVRRPAAVSTLFAGVEVVAGDLTRPSEVSAAVRDCDIAVHLAAHLHVAAPSAADLATYEAVNVLGTEALVRAAQDHGIQRLVLASTIAVYGGRRGAQVDERTTPQPDTAYAASKLRAEQMVLEVSTREGRNMGTVLRLAAVYGSRMKGNYRRLLEAVARGRFVPIGSGSNRRTLVHEDDVARAIDVAVCHPAAAGRVFNITDGRCHTLAQIIASISAALGRRAPRWSIPVSVARGMVDAGTVGARFIGRRWQGRQMLDKYLEDTCVSGARAQLELGFRPTFDLTQGWEDVVNKLRARGELK